VGHKAGDEGEGGGSVREIKFRAWDKVLGEMFYSSELANGDIMVLHMDGRIEISDDDTYKPDDFILMQFTGLKDKNGVEIYEGDIVSGTALSRNRTGVIVWIDELAGFGVRYAERNDPTAWQESSILKNIATHNYSNFCAVVIGNIHDNPDLLEGGKADAD
jgi:uncharacterized phage protein (TIGR01671 family)